ncbi:MAG: response regulator [Cytophagales bacterium]|nr:response regulator [Cytophagales bacterium]
MAKLLRKAGYATSSAPNGEEAMKLLCHDEYSAVVTDDLMPIMDGIELSKSICQKIPVLLIGAHEQLDLDHKLQELGICFIHKEEVKKSLVKATAKAIERHQIDQEIAKDWAA